MLPAQIIGGELVLYGEIDPDFGIRAADVIAALAASTDDPLTVRINSPGGAAFEGLAIYNALRMSGRTIVIRVDAIAASIASIIAMAGSEIIMAEDASMMIHNPYGIAIRDADGFDKVAADLRIVQAQLAAIYARRTSLPVAEIESMMAAETIMPAAECLRLGFADRIDRPLAIAACAAARPTLARYLAPPSTKDHTTMTTSSTAAVAANETASNAVLAERARVSSIYSAVRAAKLDATFADELVRSGVSVIDARAKIIDKFHDVNLQDAGGNVATLPRAEQTFDNPNFVAQAIEGAIYARMSGKPAENASAQWQGASILAMGRALLESNGVRGAFLNNKGALADKIMASAGYHSTSDLPNLLTGAGRRYLQERFIAQQSPLKQLAHAREVDDFRPVTVALMSESPELYKVSEGGEITYATVNETGYTYKIDTFARGFALSRQAVINDDLGAFTDFMKFMADGAALTESNALAALFLLNSGNGPTMSDGAPLYHSSHGNKAASGGVPSITTLSAGRSAMRLQVGFDGTSYVGVPPKFMVVPPVLETVSEQILADIDAASTDDVNPFGGKLTLLVEPRLGVTAWRLFADPQMMPAIDMAYLNGTGRAPNVQQREGWNTLGIEFRAVHDFGCAATEWRGTYLNPGV